MTVSAAARLTPAQARTVAAVRAELGRAARYDDESIVHDRWIRQRYECGCQASYAPAGAAIVRTAWHEAGHAVAALAIGARFSSASIHHGPGRRDHASDGRVHGVAGGGELTFVVDAGGEPRRSRRAIQPRFGADEVAAWRFCEELITSQRLSIRELSRALLMHDR